MSDESSEEKTDDASQRKLKKLREDGVLASSSLGANFAAFGVGFAVAFLILGIMVERFTSGFDIIFEAIQGTSPLQGGILKHFFLIIHAPIASIMVAMIVTSIVFKMLVHGGFVLSMKPVTPDLSKISPMAGLKKLFSGRTLTEFLATLVRFVGLIGIFGLIGWSYGPTLINLDLCVPGCAPDIAWQVVRAILIVIAALVLISVAFDVGIQRAFFLLEQKMTKTEVKQEQKEMMGQPEIRQERRRLQRDTNAEAGIVGQAAATVYFTYGDRIVALAFDPVKTPLPKIAAKSRIASDTVRMIQTLSSRGLPGIEDEKIVEACELLPVGSNAPRAIFEPLAKHLRRIFS